MRSASVFVSRKISGSFCILFHTAFYIGYEQYFSIEWVYLITSKYKITKLLSKAYLRTCFSYSAPKHQLRFGPKYSGYSGYSGFGRREKGINVFKQSALKLVAVAYERILLQLYDWEIFVILKKWSPARGVR